MGVLGSSLSVYGNGLASGYSEKYLNFSIRLRSNDYAQAQVNSQTYNYILLQTNKNSQINDTTIGGVPAPVPEPWTVALTILATLTIAVIIYTRKK